MAKLEKVFQETTDLFTTVLDSTLIPKEIKILLIANNEAKEITKTIKNSDVNKFQSGNDIVIIINEVIFDQLNDEFKKIVLEEALAPVQYNFETGKISLSKPDVNTFSGIISKYTFEKYMSVQETIRTFLQGSETNAEEVPEIN